MTLVVLYKYINCIVDKLMGLALVIDYIANYSMIMRIFAYSLLASVANP